MYKICYFQISVRLADHITIVYAGEELNYLHDVAVVDEVGVA